MTTQITNQFEGPLKPKTVLILGSATDAVLAKKWDRNFFEVVVAINNSWRIRDDWDFNIFPKDFPLEKRPNPGTKQQLISEKEYVPAQNFFGGFVYAGGTMAFTAAYWVLKALRPSHIFFLGCDMIYEEGKTHFYGRGAPDPLREDITLRSLEAKSARFECFAKFNDCEVFNLSKKEKSRLIYRRKKIEDILSDEVLNSREFNQNAIKLALKKEKDLNYFIEDGKYWKHTSRFKDTEIDAVDKLWLSSIQTV